MCISRTAEVLESQKVDDVLPWEARDRLFPIFAPSSLITRTQYLHLQGQAVS
jgi:hypothetical protein